MMCDFWANGAWAKLQLATLLAPTPPKSLPICSSLTSLPHTQKHIEDRLEKIHQMEEEAQRLAQAMVPLIEASQKSAFPNGQPARKLHRDNDVVGNVEDIIKRKLESSSGSSINGTTRGGSCNSGENSQLESPPLPPQ